MAYVFPVILYLLFNTVYAHSFDEVDTYRAAVVEYAPLPFESSDADRPLKNAHEYINFIKEAANQKAQIIVFPEYGLVGWPESLEPKTMLEYSTVVPHPSQKAHPCVTPDGNFSEPFIVLACAAETYKIYTVVNLIERSLQEETNKTIYYNTNVVFGNTGMVIARFRKINLFAEPVFEPGWESVTFKTDFGVTFGMFICYDIKFKFPALDVLADPSVTAIIHSAAWYTTLPFWNGLSIPQGYAMANGITVLSSGLNKPSENNGGSGIFLPNGEALDAYVSGTNASKMMIQDVPKFKSRLVDASACRTSHHRSHSKTDVSGYFTHPENNMADYAYKDVNLDDGIIAETLCSGTAFCCKFEIHVQTVPGVRPNYAYKLAIFHGSRESLASPNGTMGTRNCGLVACLNENEASCARRAPEAPSGVVFAKITVSTSNKHQDAYDQPATVKHDLRPVFESTYCTRLNGNEVEINLTTTAPQDSILTFGLTGRVFSLDDSGNVA